MASGSAKNNEGSSHTTAPLPAGIARPRKGKNESRTRQLPGGPEGGKSSSENQHEGEKEKEECFEEHIARHIFLGGASSGWKMGTVAWDSVLGLEEEKKILWESMVLPMHNPQIFTGLRKPPSAMLLYGP